MFAPPNQQPQQQPAPPQQQPQQPGMGFQNLNQPQPGASPFGFQQQQQQQAMGGSHAPQMGAPPTPQQPGKPTMSMPQGGVPAMTGGTAAPPSEYFEENIDYSIQVPSRMLRLSS